MPSHITTVTIKTSIHRHHTFWLSCLGPLVLLLPNILKLFDFPIFRFWVYLVKIILSVPGEDYFECTWWRLLWAYLVKIILSVPGEDYFECTWWRLFWAYLVKIILSVPGEDYSRNLLCTLNLISTVLLLFVNLLSGQKKKYVCLRSPDRP